MLKTLYVVIENLSVKIGLFVKTSCFKFIYTKLDNYTSVFLFTCLILINYLSPNRLSFIDMYI